MTSLVPTPGWVFQPHRRFLGSFFSETAAGGRLSRAVPLASHHGLLLARLPSPDLEIDRSTGGRRRSSIVHMVVCNLLAGTWAALPPLERNWRYWDRCCRNWRYGDTGYAILTEADRSSNADDTRQQSSAPPAGFSPLFKVLVIYTNGASCVLNTFSSSEAGWGTPIVIAYVTRKVRIQGPLKHPNAVVSRSAAHWLVSSDDRDDMYIVGVDAETGNGVTVEKIVILTEHFSHRHCDEPHLSVAADGTLALLYLAKARLEAKCIHAARWSRS
jgi:hypothetical protein